MKFELNKFVILFQSTKIKPPTVSYKEYTIETSKYYLLNVKVFIK